MGGYGIEFVNARQRVPEAFQGARVYDFSGDLISLISVGENRTVYFAPWYTQPLDPNDPCWRQPPGYQIGKTLEQRAALEAVTYPGGRSLRTLIVLPNVTLSMG